MLGFATKASKTAAFSMLRTIGFSQKYMPNICPSDFTFTSKNELNALNICGVPLPSSKIENIKTPLTIEAATKKVRQAKLKRAKRKYGKRTTIKNF